MWANNTAAGYLRTLGRVGVVVAALALTLPCAVWAFSPDMLPSSAIWTNFMKKIHEKKAVLIQEEDTDNDGVNDCQIFRHADGALIVVKQKPGPNGMVVDSVELREGKDRKTWVYGFDKNGDGKMEMVVRGWFNKDRQDYWEQMLYDSDSDGFPDRFLLDVDKNGWYDSMGTDEDSDGRLDFLYDLDNRTSEVLNKTLGWVSFKEQQRKEALPLLVYSFVPELKTLSGAEPIVTRATWEFGDGATRTYDELAPGEHVYAKAGVYEVELEVEFKLAADGEPYKAWQGISLPVEAPPPGPAPLTPEVVKATINPFFGACGLVSADEQPKAGTVAELWPEAKLPEGAPAGQALRSGSIAPGELDVAVMWWRSEAEASAFLDAIAAAPDPKPDLPSNVTRSTDSKPFAVSSKVRAVLADKGGVRTAAWREGGFIITLKTNRTVEEAQRWSRLLYDMLHPAPAAGG